MGLYDFRQPRKAKPKRPVEKPVKKAEPVEVHEVKEPADGLHECRCCDCRRWSRQQACCVAGVIINTGDAGDYPATAWHYCRGYLAFV